MGGLQLGIVVVNFSTFTGHFEKSLHLGFNVHLIWANPEKPLMIVLAPGQMTPPYWELVKGKRTQGSQLLMLISTSFTK